MIIEEKIIVNTKTKNKKHYKLKGYDVSKKFIEIYTFDLPKHSRLRIKVACDLCGKEIIISYNNYNRNIERNDDKIYCCNKCKTKQSVKTNLKKYGVENVSQCKEIKQKIKETKLEKYNDENYNNPEKRKATNLEKYGSTTPQGNKNIRNKIKETCLEKYGVDNPIKNSKILEKVQNTNLEKYGYYNVGQNDIIKEKIKYTKIANGNQIPDHLLTEYKIYRKIVDSLTEKNRKILYEKWNGYDYYDGEYIKDNFDLNKFDKNYPTIDHKISIYYGFNKNISPEIISSIDNLCITKRSINSKKGKKCSY